MCTVWVIDEGASIDVLNGVILWYCILCVTLFSTQIIDWHVTYDVIVLAAVDELIAHDELSLIDWNDWMLSSTQTVIQIDARFGKFYSLQQVNNFLGAIDSI